MPGLALLRKVWIWGPLLLYGYMIYYLSSQSSVAWARLYPDYLEHGLEYFGLAVLVARALNDGLRRPLPPRILLLSLLLCVGYAITDEIHQTFVPDRFADYRDVLSDSCGAALGLLAVSLGSRLVARQDPA